jgi:hypothetical protein
MEELRTEVTSWSLASDQKLLEAIQKFSTQVIDQARNCTKVVNELGYDVTASEVTLRNTFNEFLMLGNNQFMENVFF